MTRDEVIKALEICTGANRKCEECPLSKEIWCNDILDKEALALLKSEPKRGQWISHITEDGYRSGHDCSECGAWMLMQKEETFDEND